MADMGTRNVTAAELPHLPAEWRDELVRGSLEFGSLIPGLSIPLAELFAEA
jgi:hypothetical protein